MSDIPIISQVFYQDIIAASLVLTVLGKGLCFRGHQVDVLSSRHAYKDLEIP
ncbi:MAG: hypothetical protein LUQ65_08105 [Candidatus Helarchaeota archaeon]|nr:hypothetical protein [Candidatus Helarchaeota archaeon]